MSEDRRSQEWDVTVIKPDDQSRIHQNQSLMNLYGPHYVEMEDLCKKFEVEFMVSPGKYLIDPYKEEIIKKGKEVIYIAGIKKEMIKFIEAWVKLPKIDNKWKEYDLIDMEDMYMLKLVTI
jgi:hypothetical protein